jgi:N-acetylmuramoyl-L-alanine amidase
MRRLFMILPMLLLSTVLCASTITLKGIGKSQPIRRLTVDKTDYLAASDLFGNLQARSKWQSGSREFEVELENRRMIFAVGDQFCRVDDGKYNLVYEPVLRDGEFYLPIQQTLFLLSDVLQRVLVYDETEAVISAVKEGFNISGVNFQAKINGDLLEIMMTKKLDYEVFVSEGNWINVTIHGGRVDVPRLTRKNPNDKIINIRAFQFANSAQVSVQLRENVAEFHDNYAPDPHRIQISIENTGFVSRTADSTALIRHDNYNPIDIVIIDPGHGGDHDGATGKNGLKEKDVVLDIALRVEALLEKSKRFVPVLTRHDDTTVSLEQRAQIANLAKGDLFVSIHVNSSDLKAAAGSQTFFLSPAKNDEARITELLENKDFQVSSPDATDRNKKDLDYIIMDVLQTEYLNQSRLLAEGIQQELAAGLNIKSRGIDQAGFAVLNRVTMPSALVEVAFISNKIESRLLSQEDFRQAAAEAIYGGIVKFADRYDKERKTNAGSQ